MKQIHVMTASVNGNPNIGMYGFANNKFCLLGAEVPEHLAKEIEEVLKVPVHQITICGTSLLGVFIAGNSNTILVPEIAYDEELEVLDKLKIPYKVLHTRLTALGNNILCNDKGAFVNPEFSAVVKKQIRQYLGTIMRPGMIAGLENVGSLGSMNGKGCVVHRDITAEEKAYLEETLGVECFEGTVSMGSPYVSSGIIANDNGFIIGERSSGPEIGNADMAFGFVNR